MARIFGMSRMFAALLVAALAVVPCAGFAADAARDPRPLAVWFYADWCLNCKLIAPLLDEVRPEFETRVNFVKLDFTQDTQKSQNRQLARELGFYELYLSNKATGWVALLAADGTRVGELRHRMSAEQMRAALQRLLQDAR